MPAPATSEPRQPRATCRCGCPHDKGRNVVHLWSTVEQWVRTPFRRHRDASREGHIVSRLFSPTLPPAAATCRAQEPNLGLPEAKTARMKLS